LSAESVELVRSMHPGPDVDLVALVNDDVASGQWGDALAHMFDPAVRCTMRLPGMMPVTYSGLSGLRDAWRDRLRRWATYRDEIEGVIDGGDRVVVFHRHHGRPKPDAWEITKRSATVWTVRDGRIADVDFNVPHEEALAAPAPAA
jgi:ketosteroid isomerase-like protein